MEVVRACMLSVVVSLNQVGFVVYTVPLREVYQWGVYEVREDENSYLPAIRQFWRQCVNTRHFQTIALECQLRSKTYQTGRLQATLEVFFEAEGYCVQHPSSYNKYLDHGLKLDLDTRTCIGDWLAAAEDADQQLSKAYMSMVVFELTAQFLWRNKQDNAIRDSFYQSNHQDGMANALIQALAYCNMQLDSPPHDDSEGPDTGPGLLQCALE